MYLGYRTNRVDLKKPLEFTMMSSYTQVELLKAEAPLRGPQEHAPVRGDDDRVHYHGGAQRHAHRGEETEGEGVDHAHLEAEMPLHSLYSHA